MANGQDKDSIDKLSYSDMVYIYRSFQLGLAGPFKDYIIAYNTNPQFDKSSKHIEFIDLFKQVNDCYVLKEDSRKQTKEEMAKAAMEQLGFPG